MKTYRFTKDAFDWFKKGTEVSPSRNFSSIAVTQILIHFLHKDGLLEEVKEENEGFWKPKEGEWYFSVGSYAVETYKWEEYYADKNRYDQHNVFRTREEAEAYEKAQVEFRKNWKYNKE